MQLDVLVPPGKAGEWFRAAVRAGVKPGPLSLYGVLLFTPGITGKEVLKDLGVSIKTLERYEADLERHRLITVNIRGRIDKERTYELHEPAIERVA